MWHGPTVVICWCHGGQGPRGGSETELGPTHASYHACLVRVGLSGRAWSLRKTSVCILPYKREPRAKPCPMPCHCSRSCNSTVARFVAHPLRHGVAPPKRTECVFMTGGPRAYLPGLLCVLHRLESVKSVHPLVLVVPEEEVAWFQTELDRREPLHSRVTLMAAAHFNFSFAPGNAGGRRSWADIFAARWARAGFHVLDKLNVLAAPFGRVVWLDADIMVRLTRGSEICTHTHALRSLSAACRICSRCVDPRRSVVKAPWRVLFAHR